LHSCRVDGGSSRTSVSIHGLGYLFTALRRQGLIPDELVLQLAAFLRSHDLFLELRVRTPRTLTANQARQGGKQDTDGRERSRIHFRCLALTSLLRASGPKINYFFNVEIIFGADGGAAGCGVAGNDGRLRGWAYRTRTGESVRALSDWNPVTTSPEIGASRAAETLPRANCMMRMQLGPRFQQMSLSANGGQRPEHRSGSERSHPGE
jgi:hypothetical protein